MLLANGIIKKISSGLLIIAALVFLVLPAIQVSAANLTQRSITVGTSVAGAVTTHTLKFNITTPAVLGSIKFEYCSNSPLLDDVCTVPAGLVVNASTLTTQVGEIGFSVSPSSTANKLILSRVPVASLAGPVQYVMSNITNPTIANTSTYVRISTYASNNATGGLIDKGGMVFSTAGNFGTNAYVPPLLLFCTGVTVAANCTSVSGDSIGFGTLLPIQTAHATSQFAAATNDPTGYVIFSLGTTMTSGNHVISSSLNPNPSVAGISQFGINLRSNSNPSTGQDVSGVGTGGAKPNYNTPNLYMFEPGAPIAQSIQSTDFNVYTTTYIANVSLDQAPGVYVTTITYMAVAQF
jgi:hypothetical protein